jgi:lipase maturation factor 1
LLLDDFVLERIVPSGVRRLRVFNRLPLPSMFCRCWPKAVTVPLAVLVIPVSLFQMAPMFRLHSGLWLPTAFLNAEIAPFRTVNSYGLFAVMTTERREIIIEGSNDGVTWLPYEFKYKPGDVSRRPGFIEPFQPRLDWQMWFAALGNYRQNPWIVGFCARLLQGSPEVLALLAKNPFPSRPPRFLRAEFYEYHFTDFQERHASGAWWKREPAGEYLPAISLADLQKS